MTMSRAEQEARAARQQAQETHKVLGLNNQPVAAQTPKAESNSELDLLALQEQIATLQSQLATERTLRTEAEENALAVAQAGQFFTGNTEEQPTGNTIVVKKCTNPHERDEKKQKWIEVDVPTFFYTIDLPAGAGLSLSTNGVEYYHGQAYEFDFYTLGDIKSRVARCWDHEKSIHGDNENAYRKPANNTSLISAAARQRGAH